MREHLLIANWKMNGDQKLIQHWIPAVIKAAEISHTQFVVCPPAIYLPEVAELAKNSRLYWGAQDVSNQGQGAYTGQISAQMLQEFGCKYVIVGHSERRQYNFETDELVAEKFAGAQARGLAPVLCIGETLEQYKAGQTQEVVSNQLAAVLKHVGIQAFTTAVIAYEPVWAIGTGLAATPAQAEAVHAHIRNQLTAQDSTIAARVLLLYGGSVKPDNAVELFAQPNIDGGLVGGASLDAETFVKISEGFLAK